MRLKEEIVKKRPHLQKKVVFHVDNTPNHKSMATMVKYPPYSLELPPSYYRVFADLKEMPHRRLSCDAELIAEIEGCFEAKDKLFCKKDIQMLEKR